MPEIAQPETSVPASADLVPSSRLLPPGPGLPESILWLIGAMTVQLIGTVIGYVAITIKELASHNLDMQQAQDAVRAAGSVESLITVMSIASICTLCFTGVAAILRLGARGFTGLGFHLPSPLQAVLVVCLVLPLQLICSKLFQAIQSIVPDTGLEDFMKVLQPAPLFPLIILVGVIPALWEELLCRGLVGRGLVSRWGVIPGMVMTSILFGIMHLNPAHALVVIPLGLALHFVYLTTRTLWAPMLLHFLNNAMSVVVLKQSDGVSGSAETDVVSHLPLPMLTVSVTMTVALLLLLWQTRTRFIQADGSEWNPGYSSLEVPPVELRGNIVRESPRRLLLACSAVCLLGFLGVVWQLSGSGILASK